MDRIVPASNPAQIEKTTLSSGISSKSKLEIPDDKMGVRMRIARRAAMELEDGHTVNLGVGMCATVHHHLIVLSPCDRRHSNTHPGAFTRGCKRVASEACLDSVTLE